MMTLDQNSAWDGEKNIFRHLVSQDRNGMFREWVRNLVTSEKWLFK